MNLIPFNYPYFTGKESEYIMDAFHEGKISANGKYTQLCQEFLETKYGFKKSFLTNSCTQALEMATLLMDLKPGDEIIMPSFTFVSTANAFALRGCKIIFVDSRRDYPGMDENLIEGLISKKTRAIVAVHYGGIACDMEKIVALVRQYGLFLVEDAAPALEANFRYKSGKIQALGTFGHFAAFSFHETKNISTGEGGLLVVNDERFFQQAERIRDKGTNRSAYFEGQVDHYEWVSLGSAYGASEIMAACLWAQLQEQERIQSKRRKIWEWYDQNLGELLNGYEWDWMKSPDHAVHNFHIYYGVAKTKQERDQMISHLKEKGVMAVFHYQCLHQSHYYLSNKPGPLKLVEAEKYSQRLLRFPLFADLEIEKIANLISRP
ncbi:MAG: dTDP-4-amino-4,6-dideoxygalactose transaminase [Cyclobacteriaceae bacterium]